MKFKVGDRVKLAINGNVLGVVTGVDNSNNTNYPFTVKIDDGYTQHYNEKGLVMVTESSRPPEPATEAKRFNQGKVDYSLLPLDLFDGFCKVMTLGSSKYGRNNFRKGYLDLNSPLASIMRHTMELQQAIETEDSDGTKGHLLDKESGEAHVHHLLASVVIMVQALRVKGYKV